MSRSMRTYYYAVAAPWGADRVAGQQPGRAVVSANLYLNEVVVGGLIGLCIGC